MSPSQHRPHSLALLALDKLSSIRSCSDKHPPWDPNNCPAEVPLIVCGSGSLCKSYSRSRQPLLLVSCLLISSGSPPPSPLSTTIATSVEHNNKTHSWNVLQKRWWWPGQTLIHLIPLHRSIPGPSSSPSSSSIYYTTAADRQQ